MTRPALMRHLLALVVLLCTASVAFAHVGSKDVFQTIQAGPYALYVTVRTPSVIPGVATVEVRSTGAPLTGLQITPLPVTGEASKHPPAADIMTRSRDDASFFTGAVWIMAAGAWQIQLRVEGPSGIQTAAVPVVALPVTTLHMQKGLGSILSLLGFFLVLAMVGIIAAAVRESRLAPGLQPNQARRRRALVTATIAAALLTIVVYGGATWWNVEAADYADNVFRPANTTATLDGDQLDLRVSNVHLDSQGNPDAEDRRRVRLNNDYLPDHGRLMHLYAIRQPQMDAAFHLHPTLVAPGDFRLTLPAMPPGNYKLYGDVVHATGLPETLLASVTIPPGLTAAPLASDDARATPAPLAAGMLGATYLLPDGYSMVWDRPATLTASTAYTFHFTLLDPHGAPATDMQPYLGMAGHAAFVKSDGSVFAHTHPEGSAAMADVMLADESLGHMEAMDAPQHVGPSVNFPYGFPSPGRYRIFIQMKHAGVVETGVFDADVK